MVSKADRTRQTMLVLRGSFLQSPLQQTSTLNGLHSRRYFGVMLLKAVRHFAKMRYLVLGGVGTSVMAAKMVMYYNPVTCHFMSVHSNIE